VRAERLTRHSVFDALRARACYGTTGARMILDFQAAGTSMGGETSAVAVVPFSVRVHGTGEIDTAEVVRVNDTGTRVVAAWRPTARDLVATGEDREDAGGAYYLRVWQREPYRGRRVQGWTSPIWVTIDERTPRR
jgi:hypothetical protein